MTTWSAPSVVRGGGGAARPAGREQRTGQRSLLTMGFSRFLDAGCSFIRAFVLLMAIGLPFAAQSQPMAVRDLAVLVDADGSETIASVSAPEAAQRFTPLDGLLSAGYTRKVHWLRFSVQAPAAGPWWLEVMPPFLDDLRLFTPDGVSFAERRAGDRLPFASREEDYRGFIFKLALADSAPHTYYLRLQTTSTSLLTLQLWQPERFHAATNLEYTTIGLSFGFFLLILLLNLTLWFDTRESLYGWFGLFVGSQLLFFFCFMGLASQYLLPLAPLLTDAATGASVLMFLAVSPAFYRRMLHVERDQGLLFNVFRLLALLPCLLLVSLLSGHYPEAARMAQASSALAGLLTLYLAVQLWRQGRQESRYLLLATALTPLTSVGGALLSLGLISTDLFTDLMQIQRWSPLVVILSLQVALAVRMQEAGKARRLDAQRAVLAENDAMHELQVHKIELEAQNEELRRAHAETDSSKARYCDFYDMAPVGYCTVSASGLIRQANLTAGALLGQPRTALLHKPMTRFILPLDQDIFYQLRKRIDNTGEHQDCELRLLKKDGAPFWVRLDVMASKDDEGATTLRVVITNVSLHKQLEFERDGLRADIEHHEARWAAAAEALGEGFWEWDMATGEMLRSRVFDAALGYGEQDLPLTADAWVELIHPEDLASNASCLQNYLTGISATYKVEMRVRAKDGNYQWIVCRGTGIAHDAAGVPTRMIGMHTDISERKQIEAVRDSTLALLKNVASRVPGMVYQYHLRVDGSSNFPYASEAIRDIYRVSPQQAFQNATVVFAAIHPDDHDVVVISVQQSAADITPWLQEYRVKFDDGTVRWLLGSAVPQRQADGGTLWHGFITDITERRKTEAALAEKAQLLVTVLANSSVGIIFIRDRRQVWSNRRMSEMFGYTLAELENQSPGLIYPSVQSQEKFVSIAYPALARDGHFTTPWEMRRKDGSLLWISLSGTSVDRKDPGAGSIWVVEDISKRRQTERDLVNANDELTFQNEEKGKRAAELVVANDELTFQNEEKGKRAVELTTAKDDAESANLAKSRFLATMSHEIRTPMNAVLGLLQLLALTELSSQQTDYIQKTRQAAHSMLQLLNDILDISRLESDKTALEVQPFALDDLMRELSTLLSTQLEDKRIELLFDIDTAIPKLLIGDVLRLKQILFNLGNNAVKFTQQGDVLIQIRMLNRTPGQVVLSFAISDTGIGIAPENQQPIFSAFSQAESSITRRFGGTGLGLSISKKLVELMGGKIELSSVLGQGSTFSISVPLQIPTQEVTELKPDSTPVPENLQVLLVENHPKACQLEQAMAQSLGLQTDTASTGAQALALIEARRQSGQAPYQLVLMDEDMSDMDGWQASQRIREISAPERPPLIIMLARSPRQALSRRKEPELALLSAYLVKPITAGMLADALDSALKGDRKMRNQAHETVLKQTRLQGLRLLVAEDNTLNQRVMQELLRTEGAEVELADNGELAVAAIVHSKQTFDAVLMDIQMPVMDGYGATSVIRLELGLTELPIIALSANNSLADRKACLSAGMNDHIGKPFDMTQLVQVILSHTGRASEAGNLPPAAPAAPDSTEHPVILDISVLDRLSGNPAMLRELLESYLKEISNAPDQLQAKLDKGDFTGAAHLSHTLIGISAIVGAKHLAAVARLTQDQLKSNPLPTELASLCSAFRAAVTLTHSTLLPVVRNLS